MSQVNAKDVLTAKEYSNYRSIKAVSVLFALIGFICMVAGVVVGEREIPNSTDGKDIFISLFMVLAGLSAFVGSISIFLGKRRWSWLVYLFCCIYIFAIPVGTILSIVMLMGLSKYLRSVDKIKAASLDPQPENE